jgi:hypothetical protein
MDINSSKRNYFTWQGAEGPEHHFYIKYELNWQQHKARGQLLPALSQGEGPKVPSTTCKRNII